MFRTYKAVVYQHPEEEAMDMLHLHTDIVDPGDRVVTARTHHGRGPACAHRYLGIKPTIYNARDDAQPIAIGEHSKDGIYNSCVFKRAIVSIGSYHPSTGDFVELFLDPPLGEDYFEVYFSCPRGEGATIVKARFGIEPVMITDKDNPRMDTSLYEEQASADAYLFEGYPCPQRLRARYRSVL